MFSFFHATSAHCNLDIRHSGGCSSSVPKDVSVFYIIVLMAGVGATEKLTTFESTTANIETTENILTDTTKYQPPGTGAL